MCILFKTICGAIKITVLINSSISLYFNYLKQYMFLFAFSFLYIIIFITESMARK